MNIGENRGGEKLPHVSLGLIVAANNGLFTYRLIFLLV